MARIAGITIERDAHGNARYARIDLRKYGEQLQPFLKKIGIQDEISPYDKKEVKKLLNIKSDMNSGARQKVDMSNFWE